MSRCIGFVTFVLIFVAVGAYVYLSASYAQDRVNDARSEIMNHGVRGHTILTAATALEEKFLSFVGIADTLKRTYEYEGLQCHSAAEKGTPSALLSTAVALQTIWKGALRYSYISYEIPGTGGLWSDCGCTTVVPSSSGVTCFYVSAQGTLYRFEGANMTHLVDTPTPNSGTQSTSYVQEMKKLTVSSYRGVWLRPYMFTPSNPPGATPQQLVTFTLPIQYGPDGHCTAAAAVDFSLEFVGDVIAAARSIQAAELVLLDTRGNGSFVASSNASHNKNAAIYDPTHTPFEWVNLYTDEVFRALGNTFSKAAQFVSSGYEYSSTIIMTNWALYERIPQSYFFSFVPKEKVSFVDLFATYQVIALLSTVVVMVFAALAMCMNTCSKGETRTAMDYPLNT